MESKQSSSFTISLSKETMMQILIAVNFGLLIVYGFQIASIKSSLDGSGGANKVAAAQKAQPSNAAPAGAQQAPSAKDVTAPGDDDYYKGNKSATISIIEYSDFDCPFCQRFHPTAQQAVDTFDGEVNWVFRHFPLNIHPNAAKKAEAAECAGALGGDKGFWDFTDAMFEAGVNIPLTQLGSIASSVGLNQSKFQSCLDNGEQKANVDADFASGQAAGVTGTPGNIIYNNETGESLLVPGALPFAQIQAAINQLL